VSRLLGHIPIDKIQRREVEEAFQALLEVKELTCDRVNRIRRMLHCMFNRAVEWEMVTSNPISGIRPLPSKRHIGDQDINYLTQPEAARLLDWLRQNDEWLYPKVRLLLNTGLRIGEMVALRVGDLKPSEKGWYLNVSRTYCRFSHQVRNATKGSRARLIPLGRGLGDFLFKCAEGRGLQDPLLFKDWAEYRHQTKFNKHYRKALAATQVRVIRVHDMRHSFAVHFLENGGHLYDLQKLLGHQSSQLTERYSHFSHAMSERARGLVDHHADPVQKKLELTVADGEFRPVMSHECPTSFEMTGSTPRPSVH